METTNQNGYQPRMTAVDVRREDQNRDYLYDAYASRQGASRAWYFANLNKEKAKADQQQDLQDKWNIYPYQDKLDDLEKYLDYANEDYIRDLARSDDDLATALQQATESYSAGNIFGSGVAKQRLDRIIGSAKPVKDAQKQNFSQIADQYATQKARTIRDFQELTKPAMDLQRQDLEDRFKKARGGWPKIVSKEEFITYPNIYL